MVRLKRSYGILAKRNLISRLESSHSHRKTKAIATKLQCAFKGRLRAGRTVNHEIVCPPLQAHGSQKARET